MMRRYRTALIVVLLASAGCGGESAPSASGATSADSAPGRPWFKEASEASGLVFEHSSGHDGAAFLFPEIMGGGAALFDMDGDGDLDVYLVQSGTLHVTPGDPAPASRANQLFRNSGSGVFENITESSGAGDRGYGMGVTTGDYDGDGDVDLFVTNVGRDTLLSNDGAGHFTDVTAEAGVGNTSWGTSAAFLDHDLDGDLDLFVCNYVAWTRAGNLDCVGLRGQPDYCSPNSLKAPQPDTLYRNDGDGSFTDISADAGLRQAFGNGLGVTCGDFDSDGQVDIFVANDQMSNQLWHNNGDGTFTDVALEAGCAVDSNGKAKAGMGTHCADVDDDGDLDLIVVNLHAQADSFYRNEGNWFRDDTSRVGLGASSRRYTRFGTGWVDFDNDGYLDLYQANGRVTLPGQQEGEAQDPLAEANVLMRGTDTGRFEAVTPQGGTAAELVATSRAAAFGDLDGDGGMDVVVVNRDGRAHVLLNIVQERGHWLRLRVLNRDGRDAIGATVIAKHGTRNVRRDVVAAYSYCAASDPRIHLGLGSDTSLAEVEVRWTDGTRETFGPFEADREHVIQRQSGDAGQK